MVKPEGAIPTSADPRGRTSRGPGIDPPAASSAAMALTRPRAGE